MTTDRGRSRALDQLLDRRESIGYTLPDKLVAGAELVRRLSTVKPPTVEPYFHDTAAADLLEVLKQGKAPDLPAVAARIRRNADERSDLDMATRVLATATELAQSSAINIAERYADEIIVNHLRPVHTELLEQARRHGSALAGHRPEPAVLLDAPAKVRAACSALREAGEKYSALRQAAVQTNTAGEKHPEHDTAGLFAAFADPHALFPQLSPTTPVPRLPIPTEPIRMLLWLVGDGAPARPWMPTVSEQDRRWVEIYGDQATARHEAHVSAWAQAGGPL